MFEILSINQQNDLSHHSNKASHHSNNTIQPSNSLVAITTAELALAITNPSLATTNNNNMCPWSTMECSQPAAWTTNRSLLVASCVRPFQEDRPIPNRPYPELRTWMAVRSSVISVFPTHSGNAPASPDIRPTTWLCPACLASTNSIPVPIQPTIAMTTTHIHQLWLFRPPSTRSSSASEDHPQVPVVTQQPLTTTIYRFTPHWIDRSTNNISSAVALITVVASSANLQTIPNLNRWVNRNIHMIPVVSQDIYRL